MAIFKSKNGMAVFSYKLPIQRINDATIDIVMDDPTMEAIFANCNPEDIMEQILHLCVSRGRELASMADLVKEHNSDEDTVRSYLASKKRSDDYFAVQDALS